MSFQISNYEYYLSGYTDRPYSLKEYKTTNINNNQNSDPNMCHVINVESDNNLSEISAISSSLSSSLSSQTSQSSLSSQTSLSSSLQSSQSHQSSQLTSSVSMNHNIIRSCDHFSGRIVETNDDLGLTINDMNRELRFNLNFGNININSYELIEMTNKFGAKNLQKNFQYKKIFKYFRKSDILKLYDKNEALKIIQKVQEIFSANLPTLASTTSKERINKFNFTRILNDTDTQWKSQNQSRITMDFGKYLDYTEDFITNLESHEVMNDYTYVRWFEPIHTDKLIIFGDFHGSFSTFVRHLLRFKKIGVIDENGKIKIGHYLIFLGDIVDRGIYSYEILMILYLLIINNPDQIILNNGNHEELTSNGRINKNIYGTISITDHRTYIGNFINELLGKFKDLEEMLEIYTEIQNVMRFQPSAILCRNPNDTEKIIFMAHGGLPHDKKNRNELEKSFRDKMAEKKSFYIHNDIGVSIRWNDFYGADNTDRSMRTAGDNSGIQKIGKNVLDNAKFYGIIMVIRGHEDLHHNMKLIGEGSLNWVSIKEETKKYISDPTKELKCKSDKNIFGNMTHAIKVDDIINKLNINNRDTNYLPIITISTNTDIGKNLTSDSYIVISFDNTLGTPDCVQNGGYKYKYHKYYNKIQIKSAKHNL
jgi:hypothetical protein